MKQLRTDISKFTHGLLEGCDVTAKTLGPDGRNVIISEAFGVHKIINDGVRIINSMNFEDEFENAGLWVAKNCSAKTNDDVGDGTTTTVVLLKAIIEEALKRPESRAEIKRSLEEVLPKVVDLLKKSAIPMKDEDVERVAYLISEHNDIAKFIKEIYEKLGHTAAIQIEDSNTNETKFEIEDGYKLYEGLISEGFMQSKETRKGILENVPVVVAFQKLAKNVDLMPLAQQWKEKGINQAAFFLADIDDQMLGLLVKNSLTGSFKSIVVKCNVEQLEDIASVTGSKIIGEASGIIWSNVSTEDLGFANKIVADNHTTLIQSDSESAKNRADELEKLIKLEPNMYRKARLEERVSRLRGKIAILKIGGYTEIEREYKELKAEDAIKAIPASFEEGLVMGAGKTLSDIADSLVGETIGEQILKKALKAPINQLKENSGKDSISYENIVDPCKVERVSLENAISSASMFITTIAGIVEHKEAIDKFQELFINTR